MKLVLNQFDNWQSDDPAELGFGSKERLPTPPSEVMAFRPMTYAPNTNDGVGNDKLLIEHLTYLCSIKGGIRPHRRSRYTTEHQDFHVYIYDRYKGRREAEVEIPVRPDGPTTKLKFPTYEQVAIVQQAGGNRWAYIDCLEYDNSLRYAVEHLPNDVVWDLLHMIFDAYHHGLQNGGIEASREYRDAFVEGRLKKRKQRGRDSYKVEIETRRQ